jgi:hypothetical protein
MRGALIVAPSDVVCGVYDAVAVVVARANGREYQARQVAAAHHASLRQQRDIVVVEEVLMEVTPPGPPPPADAFAERFLTHRLVGFGTHSPYQELISAAGLALGGHLEPKNTSSNQPL